MTCPYCHGSRLYSIIHHAAARHIPCPCVSTLPTTVDAAGANLPWQTCQRGRKASPMTSRPASLLAFGVAYYQSSSDPELN